MAARLSATQNNICVFYKFSFDNGLMVTLFASPLSPETGRELLGNFDENYTLIGVFLPPAKAYPFIKGLSISPAYIASVLGIDDPVLSLVQALLPNITSLDFPERILNRAEQWYADFYGQPGQLSLI